MWSLWVFGDNVEDRCGPLGPPVVWFIVQFSTDPSSGVAWVAHVTGFVIEVVVTLVVKPQLARTRHQATWGPG
jgi:membrane associated rhomboid family serine protease